MAKINILDSSIFNLISAGEVVDKPMSVVKELTENSIDAGATNIEVEIKNGGIDLIRVTDNGCGIEREEIHKAFLPHATSKISSVEDLNSILTLGFRGEALASIAAVAKVTLTSRVEGEELGYTVIYDGGVLVSEYECGAPKGTTITVENIFEKIPARQKYLRSAMSEEADIANLITRLILANPKISFKYDSGGNKKINSTGESEKSALIAVYGNEILSQMEEISLIMPDITIRGFIGKPSFSKHSRNYQTLVVNGRYVKNEDISYMVYLCYKDFLMSRQYPTFVIYIDLPADMVDVNVHPNKMDVKFVQLEKIKKQIKSLINAKLNKIALTPKTIENIDSEFSQPKQSYNNAQYEPPKTAQFDYSFLNAKKELRETLARSTYVQPEPTQKHFSYNEPIKTNNPIEVFNNNAVKSSVYKSNIVSEAVSTIDNFLGEEPIMTVGTLFSTYIIVEQGESCYLIDQHAAHERMLYDKLVKQLNEGKPLIQSLLFPFEFDLLHEESALLDEHISIFSECGFEIIKDRQKYSISAVPAIVAGISLSEFIPMFFDAIKLDNLNKASLIKDVLAQSACKAAVKGDRLLSMDEIRFLIKGINTLDALLCPHGRPIVIKLSKTEIDKWFKRIV
ncbi:MAG: DNA mismatch repair endonuclease MutL [Clostridiales bacterium]|nr:DNA mismatch repair endonuclease MutL [Clostridiales bacterium]